jgi:hypothetical protein
MFHPKRFSLFVEVGLMFTPIFLMKAAPEFASTRSINPFLLDVLFPSPEVSSEPSTEFGSSGISLLAEAAW